jgi:hypothetical protein
VTPRASAILLVAALLLLGAAGCDSENMHEALTESNRQTIQREETIAQLQQRVQTLEKTLREKNRQIAELKSLGIQRIEHLFTTDRVTLGNTGGVNLDDEPGDDAIRVYLLPTDSHGSTIKAAGDVTVQLFDLETDPKNTLIGEYTFPAEKIHEHWYGGFGVYHFRFDCRWPDDTPPAGDKVTVRVEFLDHLTGKTHSAQTLSEIEKAPSK